MENPEASTPQLRSAESVHRRGLALAYLTCRAMIDADPGAKKMSDNILIFIDGVGLAQDLLPHELRMLQAPFGSLSARECAGTSWLSEGMAVLAWSVGLFDLPAPNQKCHPGPPAINLGMFQPGTKDRLATAVLRNADEIEMKSLTYLALNWRIGHFVTNPAEKMDLASKLKDPASPHLLVDEVELIDGDLAIDGLPLAQVPHERAGEVFFVIRERFNAFKWLQGYAPQYAADTTIQ
jgi:uncharacterized protein DUF4272